jgi:hypothetical protein
MAKSPVKIFISLMLLTAFGGALWFAMSDHSSKIKAADVAATTAANAIVLEGLIALDVETYLKDPRVTKILADKNITVNATRIGSREMANRVKSGMTVDFFFPSGIVAANQISDAAKKVNINTVSYSPFYTPMVMASWVPIAKILTANKIAKPLGPSSESTKIYSLDLQQLTDLMLAKKRWKDLPGSSAYDVSRSILVSTTDVRKSNSAAMYLALSSFAINKSELVTDKATARQVALQVSELFKRQGYQENYVNGNFDDYVSIGMGKTPLAFIYENQMVSYAISKKGIGADMVLMYPTPTIFNKVVFVAGNDKAKILGELLANDPQLQKIGIEYGFRGSDPVAFAAEAKKAGLTVNERIVEVVDPPSYEVMAEMIEVITQEMKQ